MNKSAPQKRPVKGVLSVLALLGVVAFIVGYLLRPGFIISWPQMETGESGVTVVFEATNNGRKPVTHTLIVSIGHRGPKEGASVSYPVLDRQEMTVEIAPGETRTLECKFPPPASQPTLAWVELAR